MNKSGVVSAVGATLVVAILGVIAVWWTLSAPQPSAVSSTSGKTADAAALPRTMDAETFFKLINRDDVDGATAALNADKSLAMVTGERLGETPLHRARSVAMAKLLLDHGADASARDSKYNARPVRWQISEWRTDIVKLLEGVAGGDDDIVYEVATGASDKLAARLKADPAAATRNTDTDVLGSGRSLLHVAAQQGQSKSIELLLASGADIAARGGFYDAQPLEVAAWAGYTDAVRLLIARGADVNAIVHTDNGDHTALWWAALTGRKDIVKMLLDANASVDPDLLDKMYETQSKPYPGRALPPRADYDAVIEMLEKRTADQR